MAPLAALAWLLAAEAGAWPQGLTRSLLRDARRLTPPTLARLLAEREDRILEEVQRFPEPLARALVEDLSSGHLRAETLSALDAHADTPGALIRERRVSDGLVRLGSLLRVPADLADPVLTAGPEGYPAGVASEYYAFLEASLDKIPVVLEEPGALKLRRVALPDYWRGLADRSRAQSPVIRIELFQRGRVVDHRTLDYRNPVFGVASLSYSRAVTGIAATWLALWREVRGDVTRMPSAREIQPRDRLPTAQAPTPQPEAPRP